MDAKCGVIPAKASFVIPTKAGTPSLIPHSEKASFVIPAGFCHPRESGDGTPSPTR
jgi:hypothetical protein